MSSVIAKRSFAGEPSDKPAPDNTAITDESAKMGKDEGTHTDQHGAKSESDTKKVEQPNAILSKLRVNKIGPLEKMQPRFCRNVTIRPGRRLTASSAARATR